MNQNEEIQECLSYLFLVLYAFLFCFTFVYLVVLCNHTHAWNLEFGPLTHVEHRIGISGVNPENE